MNFTAATVDSLNEAEGEAVDVAGNAQMTQVMGVPTVGTLDTL
jgi:hypothetical protein